MQRPVLILAVLVLLGGAFACAPESASPSGTLSIAVSIPPQSWLVERIGGPHVRVMSLLSPADSPHTYQPSDQQVSEVMAARVYFRMGVPFENGTWLPAIEEHSRTIRVVDLREGVDLRGAAAGEHGGGGLHGPEDASGGHGFQGDPGAGREGADPHTWLSPANLKTMARTVARVLAEVDPGRAAAYAAGLAAAVAELDRADAEIRALLAPHRGKSLFVYHPAWGYFCDAYGLLQVAVECDGKEPADAELTGFQERARREGAKVVFVQPQVAGKSAEAAAAVLGASLRTLDPLAPHVVDNLRAAARAIAESFR